MHTYAEILGSLCELLPPFAGEWKGEIGEDTDLVRELGLSSMKIMDLLMEVEDRFDVTIPLNRLAKIRTVGDLAAMLETLVNHSARSD